MIIVDLNQVMISNFMVQIGAHTNIKIEEDLLRHMILNSIRSYNQKFKDKYGEMVIASDGSASWRKGVFPYYKANRKTDREASDIDWHALFQVLNKIKEELKEFFPYRVIQVHGAEADDIIATLTQKLGNTNEKILIVSGDKDFRQLQTFMNVEQYDPVRKKKLVENQPDVYLREHIMKGDKGDGVPNFLSPDDSLVLKTRQKPISSKKLAVWVTQEPEAFCTPEMLRGYKRNQQLVDLNFIPESLKDKIMEEFAAEEGKTRAKLFNYFIEKKLKNLMTDIGQF